MRTRILYVGPLCSKKKFNEMLVDFRMRVSSAPIVFQNNLLTGFRENNVDLDVVALPSIPTFPKSNYLYIPHLKEKLESGYSCKWISSLNIPFVNQVMRKRNIKKQIIEWCIKNKDYHRVIIVYSVLLPAFKAIESIKLSEDIETLALVPDLPMFMFTYRDFCWAKRLYFSVCAKKIEKVQADMKKYVYFTEAMKDIVAPNKPYIVIEAISDYLDKKESEYVKPKSDKFIMMYAGGLHCNYGIDNLINAFSGLDYRDMELWLFGDGDAVPLIKNIQEQDKRIRYFGTVDRELVVKKELEADILIDVRNPNDEFTKYSFPSKIMEYMASGTPLLTTRLKGIPDEYYNYIITMDNNSTKTIQHAIKKVYQMDDDERMRIGQDAKRFVLEKKNPIVQSKRILDFINYDI